MGLFSRKKQQPLPPSPRYPAPSGQTPSYEPEFPHPEEHRGPEFPEVHAEPITIPPPPSFPRPQVDDKSQPEFVHATDTRVASMQFPPPHPVYHPVPPQPVVVPHPETVRAPYPVEHHPVEQQPYAQQRPRQQPIEIPVREPAFLRKPQQYPDREAVANEKAFPWQRGEPQIVQRFVQPRQEQPRPMNIPDRPLPPTMPPPEPVVRAPVSFSPQQPAREQTMTVEDKPLFVKIGQYREAMSHLELLKQKIKDAESALAKIEDLRAKEQNEINNAKTTLGMVKDKLLAIDKKLFEV